MRTCFVPFCDVKNKDQPNRTMFLAPKERNLFALWSDALPKVRELKSTDKVCYLHFKPDDVLNTFDHLINGHIIKIKRDRPRLKPNAIPCLEMTTKEEWLSRRAKNRISNQSKHVKISGNTEKNSNLYLNIEEPEQANDLVNIYIEVENDEEGQEEISKKIVNAKKTVQDFENLGQPTIEEVVSQIEDLPAKETKNEASKRPSPTNNINSDDSSLTERINLFNYLYENVHEILLPNTLWGVHRCPHQSFICFSCVDVFKMQVMKMIVIKDDGSVQLLIDGNVKTLHLLRDIDDLDSLSILLNKMEMGHLCFGRSTNVNCDFVVEPNDDNSWFTEHNEQVFLCKFCLPQN